MSNITSLDFFNEFSKFGEVQSVEKIKNVIKTIGDKIKSIITYVLDKVKSVITKIKNSIKEFLLKIKNMGKTIVNYVFKQLNFLKGPFLKIWKFYNKNKWIITAISMGMFLFPSFIQLFNKFTGKSSSSEE